MNPTESDRTLTSGLSNVSDNIVDLFNKVYFQLAARSSGVDADEKQKWFRKVRKSIRQQVLALKHSKQNVGCYRKMLTNLGHLKRFQFLFKNLNVSSHVGGGGVKRSDRLRWENGPLVFQGRIRSGLIINLTHKKLGDFFTDAVHLFKRRISNILKQYHLIKVNANFCGEYIIKQKDLEKTSFKYFNTPNHVIDSSVDLLEWFHDNITKQIMNKMEDFQERDSGWALCKIISLELNINKYECGSGSSYIKLPAEITAKKACINVKNNDEACFFWSIVSALYPASVNSDRISSYPHYESILHTNGLDKEAMPLSKISKFEKLNNISINVYMLELEKSGFVTTPVRLTSKKLENHVNLLLIQNKYSRKKSDFEVDGDDLEVGTDIKYHFCWIKDLSRLLVKQLTNHKGKIYICDRCLNYFPNNDKLIQHGTLCEKKNTCKISFPTYDYVQFQNYIFKQTTPFVVYADFESILESANVKGCYQEHKAFSVGYFFKCSYDDSLSFYRMYQGIDCLDWFSKELKELAKIVYSKMKYIVPIIATDKFNSAMSCHICENVFKEGDIIVRDHDHFTGVMRGLSHENCNLRYKKQFVIPVFFHCLTGYDSHFLIKKFGVTEKISLLPLNKEKYISFTIYNSETKLKFRFVDSLRFLNAPLSELVATLTAADLKILRNEFSTISDKTFSLLTRKGVFCYDYLDNINKLKEVELPSKENFFSQLNQEMISDDDYNHAQTVWKAFKIKNLGEYSDLYLKTDVLLLADIFENFRTKCREIYGLDPSWYFTLPGYTWDCMLKFTSCKLRLLKDIDQIMFIENGLRGGISMCSNRYSEANNKFMKNYDISKPSKYLLYLDVNNLYGWAMCQYLPYDNFEWIEDFTNFNIWEISDTSELGYILEVDLEYPSDIHDLHKDLPFCPEHKAPPDSKLPKLLTTLSSKIKYVIHYRNLKQALENGLKLVKIYRILKFNQAPWLKPYIDLNTKLRSQANSNFAKNLFKLMNNAVFGKTMENIRKHRIVKLVNNWDLRYGAKNLISNPNFHSVVKFSEQLVAIELNKSNLIFNKPLYIGMCILDISKLLMYEFHYILYMKLHVRMLILNGFLMDLMKFDTSDYPKDNIHGIPQTNKKVLGLMKDEVAGQIITHFVGLRSKMYSFKLENDKCVKKLKGIKFQVVKNNITFEDYVNCLKYGEEKFITQNNIRSIKHNLFTCKETKLALNKYDDKRFLLSSSHDTLPWGHYKIHNFKAKQDTTAAIYFIRKFCVSSPLQYTSSVLVLFELSLHAEVDDDDDDDDDDDFSTLFQVNLLIMLGSLYRPNSFSSIP
ncbi:uncharacterized protein [Euwallacea fornicatus]|uniref:uncharacterized protein n=1 Tax=Euwallacea fornicatus TaxID=995702 RepID=UPI00338FC064